jgi:hypothetical protein
VGKYYFISFSYKHKGEPGFRFGHSLIDIHPLDWQIEQYKYRENHKGSAEYSLLYWKEISKKEYEKYNSNFGY